MITAAVTFGENTTHVVGRIQVDHPLVDTMSYSIGSSSYSDFPHNVELAFFKNGEWFTEALPELAEYAEEFVESEVSTRVYPRVPLTLFASFVEVYASGHR